MYLCPDKQTNVSQLMDAFGAISDARAKSTKPFLSPTSSKACANYLGRSSALRSWTLTAFGRMISARRVPPTTTPRISARRVPLTTTPRISARGVPPTTPPRPPSAATRPPRPPSAATRPPRPPSAATRSSLTSYCSISCTRRLAHFQPAVPACA